MLVIGVDPGLTGAISLLCPNGLRECADLPTTDNGLTTGSMKRWIDEQALRALIGEWSLHHDFAREDVEGVMERPVAMPTLPAQTIASQFDAVGAIRAVLGCALKRPVHMVTPQEWKKFYGLGQDKDRARQTATTLYPNGDHYLRRVKDHNRAESILIGRYWLRKLA